MSWKLFLDDIRDPQYIQKYIDFDWTEFTVARSYDEAVKLIEERGCPEFISFDHDLAEEHYTMDWANHAAWQSTRQTGHDLAKWLVYKDIDARSKFIPDHFDYYVHSMNPVGAENIRKLLESYIEFRKGR